MLNVLEVPLEAGGSLLVEIDGTEPSGDLDLASSRSREIVARATASLEHSLERLEPAIVAISERMRRFGGRFARDGPGRNARRSRSELDE